MNLALIGISGDLGGIYTDWEQEGRRGNIVRGGVLDRCSDSRRIICVEPGGEFELWL